MGKTKFLQHIAVSTHSRLKAAGLRGGGRNIAFTVSTHSRLKAAGSFQERNAPVRERFNTQPPKGGWGKTMYLGIDVSKFQHTAA